MTKTILKAGLALALALMMAGAGISTMARAETKIPSVPEAKTPAAPEAKAPKKPQTPKAVKPAATAGGVMIKSPRSPQKKPKKTKMVDPVKTLQAAAKSAKQSKFKQALKQAHAATDTLWKLAPFSLGKAILVQGKAPGYGMYIPRKHKQYRASGKEPILIYLEPKNYSFIEQKDGVYRLGLIMDIYILDEKGEVLSGQEGFQKAEFHSRSKVREFFLNVTVSLTGAQPGKYVIKLVGRDLGNKGKAEVKVPVLLD